MLKKVYIFHSQSVCKVVHYGCQTCEGQNWNQSKWKLETERKVKLNILQNHNLHNRKSCCFDRIHFEGRVRPDLHALKHIEEVVHPCQMLNILKNSYQQCRRDGNRAGQQHSGKTGPP